MSAPSPDVDFLTSRDIVCGLETEYGLLVEGSGAEEQVRHSAELVRGYPDAAFRGAEGKGGWDYEFESPRADLRGFRVERLTTDPTDAQFDRPGDWAPGGEIRADRVLPNGARLYNDHGHPEYSTPECRSIFELAAHDLAGELAVRRAGEAYAEKTGRAVSLYKNNTDFHGASFGTHESYLLPRALLTESGFDRLFAALAPMFVARTIVAGAGKVGVEHGRRVPYQLSQRAEHFTVEASVDTLYRRPLFNTRDEPHGDPARWFRLHVICTDANRIPEANARKVGLVKLALMLALRGRSPKIRLADPVRAYEEISKDERDRRFFVNVVTEHGAGAQMDAYAILERYLDAGEQHLELGEDEDLRWTIDSTRALLPLIQREPLAAARSIDWLAKREMLARVAEASEDPLSESEMQSYDLAYADLDPDASLFPALAAMGIVAPAEPDASLLSTPPSDTRAAARGWAVANLGETLEAASWRALTVRADGRSRRIDLPPDARYEDFGTGLHGFLASLDAGR